MLEQSHLGSRATGGVEVMLHRKGAGGRHLEQGPGSAAAGVVVRTIEIAVTCLDQARVGRAPLAGTVHVVEHSEHAGRRDLERGAGS